MISYRLVVSIESLSFQKIFSSQTTASKRGSRLGDMERRGRDTSEKRKTNCGVPENGADDSRKCEQRSCRRRREEADSGETDDAGDGTEDAVSWKCETEGRVSFQEYY